MNSVVAVLRTGLRSGRQITSTLRTKQQIVCDQNSFYQTTSEFNKTALMKIINDKDIKAFLLKIDADDKTSKCMIEYEFEDGVYNLIHTEVPEQFQNLGYGKKLAKLTFDYIREHDNQMILTCDFLIHYYQKYGREFENWVID